MRRTAASLAAALLLLTIGCGDGGAEPDAPEGRAAAPISLVLDFQPNAVHTGIYTAIADGAAIEVIEPGSSTDAPKLLQAGRADLAIMDVNDLGIAREQGADLVGIAAIVQRPLASVIAADRDEIRAPSDLAGATVGVTGLPSDDAVLDTVLAAGGLEPGDVERQTIGFDSVPLLSAGRVGAATAFWNAEGVALNEAGVPTREFRVDDFGAPRYPELVVVATPELLEREGESVARELERVDEGYRAVEDDPDAAIEDLLAAVPGLEPESQRTQLEALLSADAFGGSIALPSGRLKRWARWATRTGILDRPLDLRSAFFVSD